MADTIVIGAPAGYRNLHERDGTCVCAGKLVLLVLRGWAVRLLAELRTYGVEDFCPAGPSRLGGAAQHEQTSGYVASPAPVMAYQPGPQPPCRAGELHAGSRTLRDLAHRLHLGLGRHLRR